MKKATSKMLVKLNTSEESRGLILTKHILTLLQNCSLAILNGQSICSYSYLLLYFKPLPTIRPLFKQRHKNFDCVMYNYTSERMNCDTPDKRACVLLRPSY